MGGQYSTFIKGLSTFSAEMHIFVPDYTPVNLIRKLRSGGKGCWLITSLLLS